MRDDTKPAIPPGWQIEPLPPHPSGTRGVSITSPSGMHIQLTQGDFDRPRRILYLLAAALIEGPEHA